MTFVMTNNIFIWLGTGYLYVLEFDFVFENHTEIYSEIYYYNINPTAKISKIIILVLKRNHNCLLQQTS